VYIAGIGPRDSPLFFTSPATPITSAKPGNRPTRSRLSIGDRFGHTRRASPWLTTTTSGDCSVSAAVIARPATSGIPSVAK